MTKINHDRYRHREKEHISDESVERAFSSPSKSRPAWGKGADRRKAEQAARLIDSGEVVVTKLPPAAPKGSGPVASSGLSPEMAAKVATIEAKIAAEREARAEGRGDEPRHLHRR